MGGEEVEEEQGQAQPPGGDGPKDHHFRAGPHRRVHRPEGEILGEEEVAQDPHDKRQGGGDEVVGPGAFQGVQQEIIHQEGGPAGDAVADELDDGVLCGPEE